MKANSHRRVVMTFLEPGCSAASALLAEQDDAAPADLAAQRQACEDEVRAIQARKKEALDAEMRALEDWLHETAAQLAGSQVCWRSPCIFRTPLGDSPR